jgi:hypothetical protein
VVNHRRAHTGAVSTIAGSLHFAKNPIQFQKGLSVHAFLDQSGTEEQFADTRFGWRWSGGASPARSAGMPRISSPCTSAT